VAKHIELLRSKFEIAVFAKTDKKTLEVLHEKIRSMDEIKTMKFISKEQAKEEMKEFKNEIALIEDNPFPDSFLLKPVEASGAVVNSLCAKLRNLINVDEVKYDKNLLRIIGGLLTFTKYNDLLIKFVFCCLCIAFIAAILLDVSVINGNLFKDAALYIHLLLGLISSIIVVLFLTLMALVLKDKFREFGILFSLSFKQIIIMLSCSIGISIISMLSGRVWFRRNIRFDRV
jgi:hypothetical protein